MRAEEVEQRDPVVPRGLHADQAAFGVRAGLLELGEELGEAAGSVVEPERFDDGLSVFANGAGDVAPLGDVDSDVDHCVPPVSRLTVRQRPSSGNRRRNLIGYTAPGAILPNSRPPAGRRRQPFLKSRTPWGCGKRPPPHAHPLSHIRVYKKRARPLREKWQEQYMRGGGHAINELSRRTLYTALSSPGTLTIHRATRSARHTPRTAPSVRQRIITRARHLPPDTRPPVGASARRVCASRVARCPHGTRG